MSLFELIFKTSLPKKLFWKFPGGQDSTLSLLIESLVGELRSCKPQVQPKNWGGGTAFLFLINLTHSSYFFILIAPWCYICTVYFTFHLLHYDVI